MTEAKKPIVRRQKNIVIVRQQKRFNIAISNAAANLIECLPNNAVIDMFLRFSVAHGGPDELFSAWDHWGQIETCGRGSAAVEAAIWWNEGFRAGKLTQEGS